MNNITKIPKSYDWLKRLLYFVHNNYYKSIEDGWYETDHEGYEGHYNVIKEGNNYIIYIDGIARFYYTNKMMISSEKYNVDKFFFDNFRYPEVINFFDNPKVKIKYDIPEHVVRLSRFLAKNDLLKIGESFGWYSDIDGFAYEIRRVDDLEEGYDHLDYRYSILQNTIEVENFKGEDVYELPNGQGIYFIPNSLNK